MFDSMTSEPLAVQPANRFDRMEIAGAFGDLGTLIPFLVAYLAVAGRRTGRVAGEPSFAGFQELFRPAVIKPLGDPLAAAQLGNARLATQAVQHDPDLLLG